MSSTAVSRPAALMQEFRSGLDAPICLTWELTYACNLSCVHCLSSSGRRDPAELSTAECKRVIDELERMQVFYVNIGGGEPTVRPERFGALLYHFGTRRLSFLKSPALLTVVESLASQPTARAACAAAGIGPAELPAYTAALATLAAGSMITAAPPRPGMTEETA